MREDSFQFDIENGAPLRSVKFPLVKESGPSNQILSELESKSKLLLLFIEQAFSSQDGLFGKLFRDSLGHSEFSPTGYRPDKTLVSDIVQRKEELIPFAHRLKKSAENLGRELTDLESQILLFAGKLKFRVGSFSEDAIEVMKLLKQRGKFDELRQLGAFLLKAPLEGEIRKFLPEVVQKEFLDSLRQSQELVSDNPKYREKKLEIALLLTEQRLESMAFRSLHKETLPENQLKIYEMLRDAVNFGNQWNVVSQQGVERAIEGAIVSAPLMILAGLPAGITRSIAAPFLRLIIGDSVAAGATQRILTTGSLELGASGGARALSLLGLGVLEGTVFDASLSVLTGDRISLSAERALHNGIGFGLLLPGGSRAANRLFQNAEELTKLGALIEKLPNPTTKELAKYLLGKGEATIASLLVLDGLNTAVVKSDPLAISEGLMERLLEISLTAWAMDGGRAVGGRLAKSTPIKMPSWVVEVDPRVKANALGSYMKAHPELVSLSVSLAAAIGVVPPEFALASFGPTLGIEGKVLAFANSLSEIAKKARASGTPLSQIRDFINTKYEEPGLVSVVNRNVLTFNPTKLRELINQGRAPALPEYSVFEHTQHEASRKSSSGPTATAVASKEIRPLEDIDTPLFLPPDQIKIINADSVSKFEFRDFPRVESLFEHLKELASRDSRYDFSVILGRAPENSLRKEPYHAFIFKNLNVILFVCNQEGNGSYFLKPRSGEDLDPLRLGSFSKKIIQESPDFSGRWAMMPFERLRQGETENDQMSRWLGAITNRLTNELSNPTATEQSRLKVELPKISGTERALGYLEDLKMKHSINGVTNWGEFLASINGPTLKALSKENDYLHTLREYLKQNNRAELAVALKPWHLEFAEQGIFDLNSKQGMENALEALGEYLGTLPGKSLYEKLTKIVPRQLARGYEIEIAGEKISISCRPLIVGLGKHYGRGKYTEATSYEVASFYLSERIKRGDSTRDGQPYEKVFTALKPWHMPKSSSNIFDLKLEAGRQNAVSAIGEYLEAIPGKSLTEKLTRISVKQLTKGYSVSVSGDQIHLSVQPLLEALGRFYGRSADNHATGYEVALFYLSEKIKAGHSTPDGQPYEKVFTALKPWHMKNSSPSTFDLATDIGRQNAVSAISEYLETLPGENLPKKLSQITLDSLVDGYSLKVAGAEIRVNLTSLIESLSTPLEARVWPTSYDVAKFYLSERIKRGDTERDGQPYDKVLAALKPWHVKMTPNSTFDLHSDKGRQNAISAINEYLETLGGKSLTEKLTKVSIDTLDRGYLVKVAGHEIRANASPVVRNLGELNRPGENSSATGYEIALFYLSERIKRGDSTRDSQPYEKVFTALKPWHMKMTPNSTFDLHSDKGRQNAVSAIGEYLETLPGEDLTEKLTKVSIDTFGRGYFVKVAGEEVLVSGRPIIRNLGKLVGRGENSNATGYEIALFYLSELIKRGDSTRDSQPYEKVFAALKPWHMNNGSPGTFDLASDKGRQNAVSAIREYLETIPGESPSGKISQVSVKSLKNGYSVPVAGTHIRVSNPALVYALSRLLGRSPTSADIANFYFLESKKIDGAITLK